MDDLVSAIGLMLVIEGILYGLFPDRMKQMIAMLLSMPPDVIRRTGLGMAFLGVFIVWLIRGS